jgi:LacI family transcriptional regulator
VEDVEGGDLAVTHLIEQGHSRIAFVGGPMTITQVEDRYRGALRAVERAGRPVGDLVVLDTAGLNVGEGRRAAQRAHGLPQRRRPTAAFCANDLLALGFLQQTMQQGMSVPEDMAVVGYDDIGFAEAAAIPLSSVRQPREELGRRACRLLLAEAEARAGDAPHVHEQVVFTPELVVRASSARRAAPRPGRSAPASAPAPG